MTTEFKEWVRALGVFGGVFLVATALFAAALGLLGWLL